LLNFVSGFSSNYYAGCVSSVVSTATVWSTATLSQNQTYVTNLASLASATTLSGSSGGNFTILHPFIHLEYQQTDLPSSLSTTTTSTSSRISTTTTTTTTSDSSLNTGAKAGIGVGCAIFIILLIGAIVLFLRRRHQNNLKSSEPVLELEAKHGASEKDGDARAELIASKLYPSHELKGSQPDEIARAELVASKLYPSHELRGAQPERTVELEGDGANSHGRGQSAQNLESEERQREIDHIETPGASNPQPTQIPVTSGTDRRALATRELDWLEQEERRIREQKARILAQNQ
jgi:hypothetical protein